MATKVKHEAPSSELRAALDELEDGIEGLRLAYEKFFGGIDRVPPTTLRAKLEKAMRNVETRGVSSTVIRFRLNGLRARFVTYKHYWTRMENQLERGTSRRDLLRRRRTKLAAPSPGPEVPAPEVAENVGQTTSPADPASAPGKRAGRPRPVDPAESGIDPSHLRAVFKQLVLAKRAAGESTQGLTYQALVRKLTAEAPKLKRKHGCEKLQFSVSTRGGKVRLRSEPDR